MKTVEIVTHCWRYSRLLTYQLSSLVLHRPKCHVIHTVFSTDTDTDTIEAVTWFGDHENTLPPATRLKLRILPLTKGNLCNRSIGRNMAAISTTADIVWFADADYLFGEGCLDALAETEWKGPLAYPSPIMAHVDHVTGDQYIDRVTGPGVYEWDPADFSPMKFGAAIGGIQIVTGDVARAKGYNPGSKAFRGDHWPHTRGDVRFRKSLGTSGVKIQLPNVYRMRHTRAGYDGGDVSN